MNVLYLPFICNCSIILEQRHSYKHCLFCEHFLSSWTLPIQPGYVQLVDRYSFKSVCVQLQKFLLNNQHFVSPDGGHGGVSQADPGADLSAKDQDRRAQRWNQEAQGHDRYGRLAVFIYQMTWNKAFIQTSSQGNLANWFIHRGFQTPPPPPESFFQSLLLTISGPSCQLYLSVKHETRIRTLETKNKEQEKQLISQVTSYLDYINR